MCLALSVTALDARRVLELQVIESVWCMIVDDEGTTYVIGEVLERDACAGAERRPGEDTVEVADDLVNVGWVRSANGRESAVVSVNLARTASDA